jgi:3-hydroxyisobutyrate dehydrogenase
MVAVGFVGLGNMGAPMAEHVLEAGHELTVYDIDEAATARLVEAGATAGDDPGGVAARSEVTVLSLPGPKAVRDVVTGDDGVAEGIEPGGTLVDATTSTPGTTAEMAARLDDQRVTVLGAPVSGGASGARAGTLTTMVGGDPAVVEACRPVLSAYATDVYHVGDAPGDGHVVKLLNNYLSFLGLVGACEAVALGERAGLDPGTMVEVFNRSTGRNAATEEKFPDHIVPGRYDLGFTMALMEKDVRLFSRFAAESEAPVVLGDTLKNLVGYAREELGPSADMSEVYEFVARRVGPEGGDGDIDGDGDVGGDVDEN